MSLHGRPDQHKPLVTKGRDLFRVSCPAWVTKVDLRGVVRFPTPHGGRPGTDLADALFARLFYESALQVLGGPQALTWGAASAWNLGYDATRRRLARYEKGESRPSLQSCRALALRHPDLAPFMNWPWNALCFRKLKRYPHLADDEALYDENKGCQRQLESEISAFWSRLLDFRRALETGRANRMSAAACVMLESLPSILKHPAVQDRKIEFVDLVIRLTHALPACLLPLSIDLHKILQGTLNASEQASVTSLDHDRWCDETILYRVAVHMWCLSLGGVTGPSEADLRAWDFLPTVRAQILQWRSSLT